MQKLMTIKQFCQRYRVSRSTVYRLFENGDLPRIYIGRSVRIKKEDANAWLASLHDKQESYDEI